MAKKYEFQPDKPYSNWLSKLQLTKQQQKQVLKWCLYTLLLVVLSVAQDVVLCRMRIFGGSTDLVPCGILLICILEGTERGCIFSLAAALGYLLSGTSPGPHVLILITIVAVVVAALRQSYLPPGLPATLLCTALAMVMYELAVFGYCLQVGYTTFSRMISFLMPAVLSTAAALLIYPLAKAISAVGGNLWNE